MDSSHSHSRISFLPAQICLDSIDWGSTYVFFVEDLYEQAGVSPDFSLRNSSM